MNISYKPKQITIGGIKYKVVYQKNLDDFGTLDTDKKIITIRDNLKPQELLDTLLHEAFHACLEVSGLSYLLDDENKEEALVRAFDSLMLPTIKRELKKVAK
jgi:Zn-dependent peptidase ImmA (M78 family)